MPNEAGSIETFLVDAKAITKSYGPTHVLKGVDFAVAAGEVHALLGGNGAGKSTLIKIMTGATERDGGTLSFNGRPLEGSDRAALSTIAVVHQELALLPDLTVAENISLPQHKKGMGLFSQQKAYRMAIEALALIDRDFTGAFIERQVKQLSLHEQQMVEIARVLSSGAQLLLLDEPTANLTAAETERLFQVLRRLVQARGIGVVFVSHRMREIREIADVCTIIRDGRNALHRARIDSVTDAEIIERMGQAEASHATVVVPATGQGEPLNPAEPMASPASKPAGIARQSQTSKTPRLEGFHIEGQGIDLQLETGTILGLAGAPSGPAALIDTLVGTSKVARRKGHDWRLSRNAVRLEFRTPRQAVSGGIGFVSGDRANKGVLATLPIIDNLMASRRVVQSDITVPAAEIRQGRHLLSALNIKVASLWSLPEQLSGGTQQKLLIARWLDLNPALLVLEEPTRGVDIGTKREIYALIRHMAAEGTTIIWWSTENVELIELCDSVLAFDPDGRPTQVLQHGDLTEERLADATGMAA